VAPAAALLSGVRLHRFQLALPFPAVISCANGGAEGQPGVHEETDRQTAAGRQQLRAPGRAVGSRRVDDLGELCAFTVPVDLSPAGGVHPALLE
jgi:hypothetical protein